MQINFIPEFGPALRLMGTRIEVLSLGGFQWRENLHQIHQLNGDWDLDNTSVRARGCDCTYSGDAPAPTVKAVDMEQGLYRVGRKYYWNDGTAWEWCTPYISVSSPA